MAEKKTGTPAGNEKNPENSGTPAANGTPKGGETTVSEKKNGVVARTKAWLKKNKKTILAGAAGVATGVGATIGVAEIGKRTAERKARKNYVPQEQETYSPLDPNV